MPYKDPEKRKQYNKKYNQENKRGDDYNEYQKKYKKSTYSGKKTAMKTKWKSRGVILREGEDWDSVFCCYYITDECMICNSDISDNKYKCLDHCHETGFIRSICCKKCNHRSNEIK